MKFELNYAGPMRDGISITPHNTNEIADADGEVQHVRGLYVGASGDVTLVTPRGTTLTFVGLAAGVVHPIPAKIVKATGTDATGIIGIV